MIFHGNWRYLIWYIIWDIISSGGEWIELPKLDPFVKTNKINKPHTPSPERSPNGNESNPVSLDYNLEQLLLQVHKTLATEAHGTVDKKEHFLQTIKKRLLSEIWSRSHMIWARTGVEGRGHSQMLTFPSLEGALMTISFLTFAVFLIKIVRQFIQGLQGANGGNIVGIELPGTMVTPAKVVKHKRSARQNKSKILEKNLQCSHGPLQWYSTNLCN